MKGEKPGMLASQSAIRLLHGSRIALSRPNIIVCRAADTDCPVASAPDGASVAGA
jgi:hypothetical protein